MNAEKHLYRIPFILAAIVAFEEASYTTSEMFRGQEVCVAVANGIVLTGLVVHTDLLPSTATGESQTLTSTRKKYTWQNSSQNGWSGGQIIAERLSAR